MAAELNLHSTVRSIVTFITGELEKIQLINQLTGKRRNRSPNAQ